MLELIQLKSKLKKMDYKIWAGINRIWNDTKLQIQIELARHKVIDRHEVMLPGMSITAKCHVLSCKLHLTLDYFRL